MPTSKLTPADLRLTIAPNTLGFTDTSELQEYALPWIGQERAEMAAHFGLGMDQPDYNLFVLGEVGSGRSSLLRQAMATAATNIHTAEHASEGLELLTGLPAGMANAAGNYPSGSLLGHAQKTLQAYRRACQASGRQKARRKHLR